MFVDTVPPFLLSLLLLLFSKTEILLYREETCRDDKKMRIIVAGRGFVFVAD